jgi:lipopolysaccharide/colanic/teichoic acid biosynthesis glycosyltransferase
MTIHIRENVADETSVTRGIFAVRTSYANQPYARFFKHAFETLLIILALPIVIPVIAFFALAVMTDAGGPFYTQKRIGRNGRVFRMWKLRTMIPNAHALLESHLAANPQARQEWESTQKLKNDPRITRMGRFLRKTSLDELPQLFNVLNGTMSLVGPRPMMVDQQAIYGGTTYYQLRPGITGPWQISDRNDCEFVARVHYDNEYGRTVSFGTDVAILWKTIAVVVRATGH